METSEGAELADNIAIEAAIASVLQKAKLGEYILFVGLMLSVAHRNDVSARVCMPGCKVAPQRHSHYDHLNSPSQQSGSSPAEQWPCAPTWSQKVAVESSTNIYHTSHVRRCTATMFCMLFTRAAFTTPRLSLAFVCSNAKTEGVSLTQTEDRAKGNGLLANCPVAGQAAEPGPHARGRSKQQCTPSQPGGSRPCASMTLISGQDAVDAVFSLLSSTPESTLPNLGDGLRARGLRVREGIRKVVLGRPDLFQCDPTDPGQHVRLSGGVRPVDIATNLPDDVEVWESSPSKSAGALFHDAAVTLDPKIIEKLRRCRCGEQVFGVVRCAAKRMFPSSIVASTSLLQPLSSRSRPLCGIVRSGACERRRGPRQQVAAGSRARYAIAAASAASSRQSCSRASTRLWLHCRTPRCRQVSVEGRPHDQLSRRARVAGG